MVFSLPTGPQGPHEDVQAAYTAHVFGLRGWVPQAGAASAPRIPSFHLSVRVAYEGDVVDIEHTFDVRPIAAFVDSVPATLLVRREPGTERVRVSIVVPKGTKRGGLVKLAWPLGELYAAEPLWVRRRSLIEQFVLQDAEASHGSLIIIGRFPEEVIEVHVGGVEVAPGDIDWDAGLLRVVVPSGAASGPVLVVTATRVYRSDKLFRPSGLSSEPSAT